MKRFVISGMVAVALLASAQGQAKANGFGFGFGVGVGVSFSCKAWSCAPCGDSCCGKPCGPTCCGIPAGGVPGCGLAIGGNGLCAAPGYGGGYGYGYAPQHTAVAWQNPGYANQMAYGYPAYNYAAYNYPAYGYGYYPVPASVAPWAGALVNAR